MYLYLYNDMFTRPETHWAAHQASAGRRGLKGLSWKGGLRSKLGDWIGFCQPKSPLSYLTGIQSASISNTRKSRKNAAPARNTSRGRTEFVSWGKNLGCLLPQTHIWSLWALGSPKLGPWSSLRVAKGVHKLSKTRIHGSSKASLGMGKGSWSSMKSAACRSELLVRRLFVALPLPHGNCATACKVCTGSTDLWGSTVQSSVHRTWPHAKRIGG